MPDLFEHLAEINVPPPAPPATFDRDLHERVNRSLTIQQVLDLAIRALPSAALELLRAVAGAIILTITGNFPKNRQR